jgi:phosphoribosylamine--glycine ligase
VPRHPKPGPSGLPGRLNVLLVGGGGREHALAWKLAQSPHLGDLWLTDPRNAGLTRLGQACPVKLDFRNMFAVQRWCDRAAIDLVVVGPEGPLASGIADSLAAGPRRVFGPTREAARLEWDKAYAKGLMRHAAIPTADARIFDDPQDAAAWIEAHDEPCVVKASGLAGGKGAIVCETPEQARDAVERLMVRRELGDAGATILIEEKLLGQEVSVQAVVSGRSIWMLDACQDHKQVGEGDRGPNTGGMGAYSPTPVLDAAALESVERDVIVAAADALRRDGIDFCGVLYAGIMLTAGGPKVLEFNCRFGDPEAQPLLARMRGDLLELLWAACAGAPAEPDVSFDSRTACTVVMCSQGYPGPAATGKVITGIEEAEALSSGDRQVIVFHAGTALDEEGRTLTTGGRVLGVTALAEDLRSARDLANAACRAIRFEGAFWRRDIGDRVLAAPPRSTAAALAARSDTAGGR